jgi:nitrogen-specific signal transduction histidine kinase/ActR/RegA family two-component response regulator
MRDLTETRKLERQLQQSQKLEAVGQLAGGVAHDFNNMLTIILGYSDLLLDSLNERDPLRESVLAIDEAATRAARLTRQLLAFSRRQVLQFEVLDINAVVAGIREMAQRLIGEDITLTVSLQPDLRRVRADSAQLEQVIMNLAVNARDAMPRGGSLTIETRNVGLDADYAAQYNSEVRPGEYVLLAVSDTGHGMDKATLAHIFEPFFTTKEPGKGTGLGLAMAFGIVRQSGGHIAAYSEPGLGATFKIYLPIVAEDSHVPSPTTNKRTVTAGTETILLVEDEDAVRNLARLILTRQGYTVLEARNGGEALLLWERHGEEVDLLVTDVVMPHMSGRQVADRLRALRPSIRVLFLSGYTDDAVIRHGVIDAGVPFLQKPFKADSLAQKVREALDR